MQSVLAILNPRCIPDFEASVELLDIPTVRIRGYTEPEIAAGVWQRVLDGARERKFTHLTLISDDLVVPPDSLDAILEHASQHPDRVSTGWANVDELQQDAGIARRPLVDAEPTASSYSFPTWRSVLAGPRVQQTFFTGFVATTCLLSLWDKYPYTLCGGGWAADYSMSRRLTADGVRIDCLRDAFCLHLKHDRHVPDQRPERRLLVGEMAQEVLWQMGG